MRQSGKHGHAAGFDMYISNTSLMHVGVPCNVSKMKKCRWLEEEILTVKKIVAVEKEIEEEERRKEEIRNKEEMCGNEKSLGCTVKVYKKFVGPNNINWKISISKNV